MSSSSQTLKNLLFNITSFGVNFIISFLLTPYLIRTVGKEAYGFIPLINSIIGYPLKPVSVQGRFFIRNKNSNHTMSPASISDCLLQTQNSSWDYILDATSSIDDISLKKVEESIERINHRGYHIPSSPIGFLKKVDLSETAN